MKVYKMTYEIQIIAAVLDCSEKDAKFLVELCVDFDIDFKYVWQIIKDTYPNNYADINNMISIIYCNAIDKATTNLGYNRGLYHLIKLKIDAHNSLLIFNGEIYTTYLSLIDAIKCYFGGVTTNDNKIQWKETI